MTECYMIQRRRSDKEWIEGGQLSKYLQFMLDNDVHKFIIGAEEGASGYKHWQIRIKIRNLTAEEKKDFAFLKATFGQSANIQECSDTWEYERKGGIFYDEKCFIPECIPQLQTRFGEPNKEWQEQYLNLVRMQNVRQIDVVYNPEGNIGKSWLVNHLYETGEAYYIPPHMSTIEKITQSVASYYMEQGWRPYILIDIPRGYNWSIQLCIALESIKDGIVVDPRYSMRSTNIRGVKVIVFTNNSIPQKVYDGLSKDRWRVSQL